VAPAQQGDLKFQILFRAGWKFRRRGRIVVPLEVALAVPLAVALEVALEVPLAVPLEVAFFCWGVGGRAPPLFQRVKPLEMN